MKRKIITFALLLWGVLFSLQGETLQQLEKRLKMSSPGLPEFRVYNDMFGVTRSVRTLPGKKNSGVFKLSVLNSTPRISMLDISGVAVADMTGLGNFKELRSLRLGASKVVGLEKYSLPNLVRLDLSRSVIKDISWLKNYPGLRILHLPESVTDITPLKGRSFRALSVPGVLNSDDVCRKLGIDVAIRTAHAYRRPGRDTLPPLTLQRNGKGQVTAAAFMRYAPPPLALKGFAGLLFPEIRAPRSIPPKPEEYPGLRSFSRRVPLKVSVFRKDSATLRKLDLTALNAVEFNGESFPELEELRLAGAVINLESLKAPKLKRLILEKIEGWSPGQSVHRHRYRHETAGQRRPGVQLVKAAPNWDLVSLKISLRRDEFDFDSLKKIRFRALECHYYGNTLEWLSKAPLHTLTLSAPAVNGNASAVLGTLPLKKLNIALGEKADMSFLKKLKLQHLALKGGGKNFSFLLLRKMPLKSLRLKNVFKGKNDLGLMKFPLLTELVLDGIHFTKVAAFGKHTKLESLALENCTYSPAGLTLKEPDLDYVCGDMLSKELLKLKRLKNLRIGQLGVFPASDRIINYDFPWERFKALKLVNFSICAERADFAKEFKALKRLKVDDISRHGISLDQVRTQSELDTLVLTNARPRPDRAVPERNSAFRRPMIPAPRKEPGVAQKVYIDAPGGFDGGFVR